MKWNIIDLVKNEILETVEGNKGAADRAFMDQLRKNPKRRLDLRMAGAKIKANK